MDSRNQTHARGQALKAVALASLVVGVCASCYQPVPYRMAEDQLRQYCEAVLGPDAARDLEIPFVLDDEIKRYTDDLVAHARDDREKVDLILDAILSKIEGGIRYEGLRTRSAIETFRTGTGNCFSFTSLFVAMARHAGVPALFVMVDEVEDFEWSGNFLVHQKHMCAGVEDQGKLRIIDFVRGDSHYRSARPIPDNEAMAHYFNNLGYAYLKADDLADAEESFRLAVSIAPGFIPAMNNLGVTLMRQGRGEEAVALLREASAIDRQDLSIIANLASALKKLGQNDEARRLLVRIEKAQAGSPYTLFVKGRLLRNRGDAEGALALFKKAARKEPANIAIRLEMARAYKEAGNEKKALQQYRRVLQIDPVNAEARQALEGSGQNR